MIKKLNLKIVSISFLVFILFPKICFSLENEKIGEKLFKANCAVCHLGGNNIIIPEKNLKKDTLEENGMNSVSAITYQIINGKNGMPAFGGRLTEIDIEQIANYVLDESEKNFEN
jgi:cytochrome c6